MIKQITPLFMLYYLLAMSAFGLNVRDYGAIPNDDQDDAEAINRAIAAAAPDQVVYIPRGIYLISNTLLAKMGVRIEGENRETTILRDIGLHPHVMLRLEGVSNVEVTRLTLDGNHNTSVEQGIVAASANNIRLHHLVINDLSSTQGPHGIFFISKVTDSTISDNRITNIGLTSPWGAGIRISHNSARNQVIGNAISGTGRGGILCNDDSTSLVIRNNVVARSGGEGLGIELWGRCGGSVVEDNTIDHWLSCDNSSGSAIRRNIIHDTSDTLKFIGLELVNSQNVIFSGNSVDGGMHIGISVSGIESKSYIYWANNSIKHATTWAVQLQGERGGVQCHYFYHNQFHETIKDHPKAFYPNQGHGFRINGNTHHIVLDGNVITDNGGAGIQFCGTDIDQVRVMNQTIAGNGGDAVTEDPAWALEWVNNTVQGNGNDRQPHSHGFPQPPTANFSSPLTARVGELVAFRNSSTALTGDLHHVLWDFDDGLPSDEIHPAHRYAQPGSYQVTLLVWDGSGQAARTERTIHILPDAGNHPSSVSMQVKQ